MSRSTPRRRVEETTVPASRNAVLVPRVEVLVEREADERSQRSVVVDEDVFRIGSHPSNDLVLDDARVSRFHCRLERAGLGWSVSDDGSMNGTDLCGVHIKQAQLRMPESTIVLGNSRLRVRELPSTARTIAVVRTSLGVLKGGASAMQKLYDVVDRVAKADANVLIEGESGTGKELVAFEES